VALLFIELFVELYPFDPELNIQILEFFPFFLFSSVNFRQPQKLLFD